MIVFNILGAVMLAVCAGAGFGVRLITGATAEGPEMMLIGALAILFDATYRIQQPEGHWISPFGGGNLFFIPVWGIGAAWFVVGLVYCFTRPIPIDVWATGLIALAIVAALGLTVFQIARCDRSGISQFAQERTAEDSDGRTSRESRGTNSEVRCTACQLPFKAAEAIDGKCPWCGAGSR